MTADDEIEVIHHDMTRMFTIIGKDSKETQYFDETNVFTLGHAKAHGIDLLDGYFKQYNDMLERLDAAVLFMDVPPDVSWNRRRHRYTQRLWDLSEGERDVIMTKYRAYLERLHDELLTLLDRLTLPKIKINATGSQDEVSRLAAEAFCQLQGQF